MRRSGIVEMVSGRSEKENIDVLKKVDFLKLQVL